MQAYRGRIEAQLHSGDFTLYDQLLDHSYNFGVIPEKYSSQGLSPIDTYFGELLGYG